MIRQVLTHKLFLLFSTVFFFLAFALNIAGALSTNNFIENDKFSESLVTSQIKCKGTLYDNQLIGLKSPDNQECVESNYLPYNSQFGLQGKFGVILYFVLEQAFHANSNVAITVYQLFTALFSALLFGLLTLWVRLKFGLTVSIVFLALISFSPMLVSFSRNIYWELPLMVAPIVYILYFFKTSFQKKEGILFFSGLILLLYLRYLCGYEYVTTITIMLIATSLYFLMMSKSKFKKISQTIVLFVLSSLVALLLAFSTHVLSLNQQTGSLHKSIDVIKNRAEERTLNAQGYTKYAYLSLEYVAKDFYKTSNEYFKYDGVKENGSVALAGLIALLAHLLLPIVHTPFLGGVFEVYAQSFIVFLCLLLVIFIYRKRWVSKKYTLHVKSLYTSLVIGVLGYASWFVFAFSHSLVHAFINGILMYLPAALFGFIIIGLFVDSMLKNK